MKIQTLSIVCGTTACNAKCPYCVSKTTPDANLTTNVNYRNLLIACKLADKAGTTTCLITGKGEPTLYPDLITSYLVAVRNHFPFIELQTNGMRLQKLSIDRDGGAEYKSSYLEEWYRLGLTTVSLSAVETGVANKKVFGDDYPDIPETVRMLHKIGFTVRLSVMMMKGYIDSPKQIARLVDFCKQNEIKQLTLRPLARGGENTSQAQWVDEHTLNTSQLSLIVDHIRSIATPVLHLAHGAIVYDYNGQNLCLTNCLTTNETDENMRQIIFFPDGGISYDWQYKGGVLL